MSKGYFKDRPTFINTLTDHDIHMWQQAWCGVTAHFHNLGVLSQHYVQWRMQSKPWHKVWHAYIWAKQIHFLWSNLRFLESGYGRLKNWFIQISTNTCIFLSSSSVFHIWQKLPGIFFPSIYTN